MAREPSPILRPARRSARVAAPPLIGVVTHELRAEAGRAWAPAPGRRERDLVPHRLSLRLTYTQAIQEAGGIAVVVPTHGFVDDTAALLDRLDGLLFTGGPDLDPGVYGQARHPRLGPDVDRVCDEYELALLDGARERDHPVLGICRGMQTLNVSRGGTLHQHVPDRSELRHDQHAAPFEPVHAVTIARGSLLHRLAVQWHPEMLTHRLEQAQLFQSLVAAARGAAPSLALAA
jgi:putative glutamine amidotransferase